MEIQFKPVGDYTFSEVLARDIGMFGTLCFVQGVPFRIRFRPKRDSSVLPDLIAKSRGLPVLVLSWKSYQKFAAGLDLPIDLKNFTVVSESYPHAHPYPNLLKWVKLLEEALLPVTVFLTDGVRHLSTLDNPNCILLPELGRNMDMDLLKKKIMKHYEPVVDWNYHAQVTHGGMDHGEYFTRQGGQEVTGLLPKREAPLEEKRKPFSFTYEDFEPFTL